MFRSSRPSSRLALAAILLAITCSKTNPIFTKVLLGAGWTPLSLYFLILLVVAIFLAMHEFMTFDAKAKWSLTKTDLLGVLLTTFTGGIFGHLLFLHGVQNLSASNAILITSLLPLWIVMFAVVFLKEPIRPPLFIGGGFLLTGLAVALAPDLKSASLSGGTGLVLLSSICSALTTTLHKKFVTHRHLDSLVLIRVVCSLIVVGLVMAVTEPQSFAHLGSPTNIWLIFGLAIIGFLLPYFLYFRALSQITTLEAGLVVTAGPGIGMLMASAFLGEAITTAKLISVGLMAFGILFINVPLTKWRIMPSRLTEMGPLRK